MTQHYPSNSIHIVPLYLLGYSLVMQMMQLLKYTAVRYNIPVIITNLAETNKSVQPTSNSDILVRPMIRDAFTYCTNQQIILQINSFHQYTATIIKNHIGVCIKG